MTGTREDALLGIDFGTGGCKVMLVGTGGKVLDGGFGEYPSRHPKPGWSEQDPEDWYRVMCGILRDMTSRGAFDSAKLLGISLDGSTHNAVLMNERMEVLRPVIMWTDQRSAAEAEDLAKTHGDMIFKIGYQMPAPTWTLPQMLWLKRNEPGVLARTEHVLFVKDYIRYKLTGDLSTDHIEAQGTLFYDMEKNQWSKDLAALCGVPFKSLPQLRKPTDIAGRIGRGAAAETGLEEGVPVVCGCSDSAIEDYAAGAVAPGQCVVKLASAGNVNVMTSGPVPSRKTLTYSHVIPGLWYTVTATNSAATCMRWFRENFCADLSGANAYVRMDKEAAASPVGANGLTFHPYLQGERAPYWDSTLRASFTGATSRHRRGDFTRAVMEGVAFSLLDCRQVLDEMGLSLTQLRLIGGGAKSDLWSRIVCDAFGEELLRPEGCDASFGAALLAGVGTGVFSDEKDAVEKCVRIKDRFLPDTATHEEYARLFERYLKIHDALADIYKTAR